MIAIVRLTQKSAHPDFSSGEQDKDGSGMQYAAQHESKRHYGTEPQINQNKNLCGSTILGFLFQHPIHIRLVHLADGDFEVLDKNAVPFNAIDPVFSDRK